MNRQLVAPPRSIVSASVPKPMRDRLERLAAANERNVSQEIRRAIAAHLERKAADDDEA